MVRQLPVKEPIAGSNPAAAALLTKPSFGDPLTVGGLALNQVVEVQILLPELHALIRMRSAPQKPSNPGPVVEQEDASVASWKFGCDSRQVHSLAAPRKSRPSKSPPAARASVASVYSCPIIRQENLTYTLSVPNVRRTNASVPWRTLRLALRTFAPSLLCVAYDRPPRRRIGLPFSTPRSQAEKVAKQRVERRVGLNFRAGRRWKIGGSHGRR